MQRFIFSILILAICTSCRVYQSNLISSTMEGTAREPFIYENDSIRLRYSFNNGKVGVEVFNKSEAPLYVDWSRSAFIMNGEAMPFWTNTSAINMTTDGHGGQAYFTTSHSTGTVTNGRAVAFIPPSSGTHSESLVIPVQMDHVFHGLKKYNELNSPMKFRSYVLTSFDQGFKSSIILEHEFWLSESYQSKQRIYNMNRPNAYTTSKPNGDATALIFFILIGVLLVSAVSAGTSAL